ncbi:luciferase domain-containing protein [Desertivirga arenae]|uniref:luciferase domain-containing protein n=1 Tax=Desertivirga arenae TaxID=2810309 RepID=UPI001A9614BA|nr:luciferase family protein [Pedobacter sp. SYSU D00823]
MFAFTVKWLGFLKVIPGLPLFFDALLKFSMFIIKPKMLEWLDEIESEVGSWEGVTLSLHKYGGVQFNYKGKEIGHLHGNGLLDVLFSRKMKAELLAEKRVQNHHVFKNSGWVSFYLKSDEDVQYALYLLKLSFLLQKNSLS